MILWNILRVLIAAAIIVAVAELSKRYPRYGALLLSLPILSILAFAIGGFEAGVLPTPQSNVIKNGSLTLEQLEQKALACNPSVHRLSALVAAGRGNWVQVGLRPQPHRRL